jgi:hypothetical protein
MKTTKRNRTQIDTISVMSKYVSNEFTCRIWNLVLGKLSLDDTVLIGCRKKYIQPMLGIVVDKNEDSISARTHDGLVFVWERDNPDTDHASFFICRRSTPADRLKYSVR